MIPSSRTKLSDLYTLSQSKLLENHSLHSDTYPHSPYMAVSPPPRALALPPRSPAALDHFFGNIIIKGSGSQLKGVVFIIPSFTCLEFSRFLLVY